ncbi:MAG: GNAT family N-acetyltransferase [Catenulispora sp.]
MIAVVPATVDDVEAISELLDEVDRFYGDPGDEPREERNRQVYDALFGPTPAARALLVKDEEGRTIALASYSFLWPAAGATRSLYLKQLYVSEEHRGGGIGELLMEALYAEAERAGCSRVEWTADRENPDVQRFYERLGAAADNRKIFYRRTR